MCINGRMYLLVCTYAYVCVFVLLIDFFSRIKLLESVDNYIGNFMYIYMYVYNGYYLHLWTYVFQQPRNGVPREKDTVPLKIMITINIQFTVY
jgi:hypothetical protein